MLLRMNVFAVFKPSYPFQVHHLDLSGMPPLDRLLIVQAELAAARADVRRAAAQRPS